MVMGIYIFLAFLLQLEKKREIKKNKKQKLNILKIGDD